jgi:hypothetical protein
MPPKTDINPMVFSKSAVFGLSLLALPGVALAQDVYQPNFNVPNTAIILPQPRIAPEQPAWNAYQNPLTAPHRTEPTLRDNDGDGIPNAFDYDDNRNNLQPPTLNQMLLPPRD